MSKVIQPSLPIVQSLPCCWLEFRSVASSLPDIMPNNNYFMIIMRCILFLMFFYMGSLEQLPLTLIPRTPSFCVFRGIQLVMGCIEICLLRIRKEKTINLHDCDSSVAVQMLFHAAFSFATNAFENSLCALEKIVAASKCKMRKKTDSGFLVVTDSGMIHFFLLLFWMRYYDALLSVHGFHCSAMTYFLSSVHNFLSFKTHTHSETR